MVKRFMAPGPWITRDLKECVLASDYDALAAERDALQAAARKVTCFHCEGTGEGPRYFIEPTRSLAQSTVCTHCADLRVLLGEKP